MQSLSSKVYSGKLISGVILSAALMCAGCSKKESVDSSSGSDVAALALLNMDASGQDGLSWDERKGDKGDYVYTNLVIDPQDDDENGRVTIKKLTLGNVGMVDGAPSFGSMIASGLSAEDDESVMEIGTFSLTDPTPETAMAMTQILSGMSDLNLGDNAELGFGGLKINSVKASSKDDGGTLTIDSVTMEDVRENYAESFSLKNLKMLSETEGSIRLAGLDMSGVDLGKYDSLEAQDALDPAKSMDRIADFNPYKPGVENLTLSGLEFDIAGFSGGLDSATRRSKKRGGVTVVTQDMSPLTLSAKSGGQGPAPMLSAMGYETLTLTGKSVMELDESNDRLVMKENYLILNDGFNLSVDYDVSGYGEMANKRAEIGANSDTYDALMDILMINKVGLTFEDQGLTDRVIEFLAQSQGTTPDRIRKQATGAMLMYSMFMEDDAKSQIARLSIEALTSFIKEPGTLKLGFYPDAPIPVSALDAASRGEGNAKALGFEASSE